MRKIFVSYIVILALIAVSGCRSCPMFPAEGGIYTYYFYSESSNAGTATMPSKSAESYFVNMFIYSGESVSYTGNKDYAVKITEKYKAKFLFAERAGDVITEYYYSPFILKKINLNGKTVNLQIAREGGRTVIGSPIIFGSF